MYSLIREVTGLIRHWDNPDTQFRWSYLAGLCIALVFWLIPRWRRARQRERAVEEVSRFWVVTKTPHHTLITANSSTTPLIPYHYSGRYVQLRFIPRREGFHSDDNDILLTCSEDTYRRLQEETFIRGVWRGEELISFTPESR